MKSTDASYPVRQEGVCAGGITADGESKIGTHIETGMYFDLFTCMLAAF